MRILLVYPRYPDTFWSFRYALKFISKRASFPPLGLLTVAAMLPRHWETKLIDMNVTDLDDAEITQADFVFVSAMVVQSDSAREVISRCNRLGVKVAAGGPLFTTGYDEFTGVDHFVLGEAEMTMPAFLADIENGCAKPIYEAQEQPDISLTPLPVWSLINMKHYASMSLQYSRGCPFNCDFCDIAILNGNMPRTKDREQMVRELDALYSHGWRGSVFVVDDNFVGNRRKLKTETLPAMIEWSKKRKYPFYFYTQASINLADDEELMQLMADAGFERVFVGIETPNEDSLTECNKQQNRGRDLVAAVKKIQNYGLEVQGGFIVGFDSDPVSIFHSQINFIQKSGIVTAMVGLLNAPRGTSLYQRLKKENRLTSEFTGNNTDCSMNFVPKMNYETLINGYRQIFSTIYSPKQYYERIRTFLKEYKPKRAKRFSLLRFSHIRAFFEAMWVLGVKEKGRRHYWHLMISTLFRRPKVLPLSIILAIFGFHFRQITGKIGRTSIEHIPSGME
ncbi:MAG: DUF4070 domain-containing protein [Chloroflexi bacterium]|nr:DUF4070 domain-containing protein [Chloroflexota bacterium]